MNLENSRAEATPQPPASAQVPAHERAVIDAAVAIVRAAQGVLPVSGGTPVQPHEWAVIAAALAIVGARVAPSGTPSPLAEPSVPKRRKKAWERWRTFPGWENKRHPIAWPAGHVERVGRSSRFGVLWCPETGYDSFKGSRAALIALGVVAPDQFPGEPGRCKTMASYFPDGQAKSKGVDGYTALQIFKRGADRFEVHVTAPYGVSEHRWHLCHQEPKRATPAMQSPPIAPASAPVLRLVPKAPRP